MTVVPTKLSLPKGFKQLTTIQSGVDLSRGVVKISGKEIEIWLHRKHEIMISAFWTYKITVMYINDILFATKVQRHIPTCLISVPHLKVGKLRVEIDEKPILDMDLNSLSVKKAMNNLSNHLNRNPAFLGWGVSKNETIRRFHLVATGMKVAKEISVKNILQLKEFNMAHPHDVEKIMNKTLKKLTR